MGCCLTTTHKPPPSPPPPSWKEEPSRRHFHQTSRSPKLDKTHVVSPPRDPPVFEEESVKEVVLSETTPVSRLPTSPEVVLVPAEKIRKTNFLSPPKVVEPAEAKEISEAASLVSESCESYSYSTTTTTTTITEVRDREDEAVSKRSREVGPRVTRQKRPNSGDLAGRRGRAHVALASRVERSSEKRNRVEASKAARGRESGQVRTTQRNGGYAAGIRRDVGEVSSRRSRSPATRAAGGVGRGELVRNASKVTGRGGGRSVGEAVEDGENKKEEVSKTKEGCSQTQTGNESLENPLVSLECFIFV